jgi:RHS repeat-associated protein
VAKTVGGVATQYLVDTNNPTGYAQVLDEVVKGQVVRSYTYGLDLISEVQPTGGATPPAWQLSYYGYDGHGSVRYLTNSAGAVTDTYDYDAFGNLISSTGSTPNNYLYAGQQWDPDLHLYYNRARYLDVRVGRFWGMDTWEGDPNSPGSLHKYLFVGSSPIDSKDPSGHGAEDTLAYLGGSLVLAALSLPSVLTAYANVRNSVASTQGEDALDFGTFSAAAVSAMAEVSLDTALLYRKVEEAIAQVRAQIAVTSKVMRQELELPKVVPIPASLMPHIATHISGAILSGYPFSLHRGTTGRSAANRLAALGAAGVRAGMAGVGLSFDEYPFASSFEGGAGASIAIVPLQENLLQGGIIIGSYMLEHINPGDQFYVVVLP